MDRKKITNREVKRKNRNGVFRYIIQHKTVSNPDISHAMEMSLPTATQITKELIERGLVEETGELESTGGRRAKALSVAANVKLAVGLDLTKNHLSMVLTNLTGDILKYERIHQPYTAQDSYYHKVNAELERFLDESAVDQDAILGIGISFPGIVDLNQEMITYSHIFGVERVPLSSVSRFFSYPCHFLNDANAGAYAEGIRARKRERFFYLSLSNTVGGAFFCKNELMQGKNFRCGEVGHMTLIPEGEVCYCGKQGCLDVYCRATRLSDAAEGKLEQFFGMLEQGEQKAVELWHDYTSYLAMAVNNIHMVLDCDVVLGGYVGSYVEPYIAQIWEKTAMRNTFGEKECYVRACNYKVGAAAMGAALQVVEEFICQI